MADTNRNIGSGEDKPDTPARRARPGLATRVLEKMTQVLDPEPESEKRPDRETPPPPV